MLGPMDAVATTDRCRDCDRDLAHCHGTYVEHEDGSWECTAPGCVGPALAHRWVVSCQELCAECCSVVAAARTA